MSRLRPAGGPHFSRGDGRTMLSRSLDRARCGRELGPDDERVGRPKARGPRPALSAGREAQEIVSGSLIGADLPVLSSVTVRISS